VTVLARSPLRLDPPGLILSEVPIEASFVLSLAGPGGPELARLRARTSHPGVRPIIEADGAACRLRVEFDRGVLQPRGGATIAIEDDSGAVLGKVPVAWLDQSIREAPGATDGVTEGSAAGDGRESHPG
jgi:hypothetical protein